MGRGVLWDSCDVMCEFKICNLDLDRMVRKGKGKLSDDWKNENNGLYT